MTHRHGKRDPRTHHRHARIFVASCVITALCLAIAAVVHIPIPTPRVTESAQDPAEDVSTPVTDLAAALPPRPVYKYSVVDGGTYSAAELAQAVAREPIVAQHYRSIDVANVRAETVPADRLVYMSYRRGNQIFWTKHKVRLQQGETILTDGQAEVRSRCGNCISLEPMEPTAEDEPVAAEFDALTADPVAIPSLPSSSYTLTIPPGLLLPPPFGSAPIGLTGAFAIGPIAENIDEFEPMAPDSTADPTAIDGIIDVPPIPPSPGDFPVPGDPFDPRRPSDPVDPSGPGGPSEPGNPSGPNVPPLVVLPPFHPPIDLPEDFDPQDPVNRPDETAPIPEPGTLLLIGSGAIGLLVRRLRAS